MTEHRRCLFKFSYYFSANKTRAQKNPLEMDVNIVLLVPSTGHLDELFILLASVVFLLLLQ